MLFFSHNLPMHPGSNINHLLPGALNYLFFSFILAHPLNGFFFHSNLLKQNMPLIYLKPSTGPITHKIKANHLILFKSFIFLGLSPPIFSFRPLAFVLQPFWAYSASSNMPVYSHLGSGSSSSFCLEHRSLATHLASSFQISQLRYKRLLIPQPEATTSFFI